MVYAIIKKGIVVDRVVSESALKQNWVNGTGLNIGDTWNGIEFIPPEVEPVIPAFDVISTDKWSIPADGVAFATASFTSDVDVFFVVNGDIYTVSPIDFVATIEITADNPGPVVVAVKNKQIVIAAMEVV